jgi:hypothetical protein
VPLMLSVKGIKRSNIWLHIWLCSLPSVRLVYYANFGLYSSYYMYYSVDNYLEWACMVYGIWNGGNFNCFYKVILNRIWLALSISIPILLHLLLRVLILWILISQCNVNFPTISLYQLHSWLIRKWKSLIIGKKWIDLNIRTNTYLIGETS